MFFAFCMYAERKGTINPFKAVNQIVRDEFTDKDIRNYQAYQDMTNPIVPHASNKIPEAKVWQMNQPAYMREAP
jgi:protein-L-isoaspartate O-methyltransferase